MELSLKYISNLRIRILGLAQEDQPLLVKHTICKEMEFYINNYLVCITITDFIYQNITSF